MSYQVLARKWRPRNFSEMVGQTHVLKTLINALENNRLHHAYLFTGTRGVGKTTIARILARCLNCETGITATPCGECSACREISEGRFLDLIEVDAASRTKVEDTRELLENIQYAPSRGRFKVYLIDEVHMLSTHSFNALLKTLEEPPAHVKFLLATTDPQKLPVTVLSRCLQFNLKNLNPERLVEHLQHILKQEQIPFEDGALWQLGRAAQGSVRDCLTLLDQAIGFCEGNLTTEGVSEFLGNIDQAAILGLVDALIAQDAAGALNCVKTMSEHSPDFSAVLQELLSWLHRVAIAQVVPDAIDNSLGDREQVLAHAGALSAETLQLYYQLALKGREDMPFALDPRSGLEMTLLRMLAFAPAAIPALPEQALPAAVNSVTTANEPDTKAQSASSAGTEQKKKPLKETPAAEHAARSLDPGTPELPMVESKVAPGTGRSPSVAGKPALEITKLQAEAPTGNGGSGIDRAARQTPDDEDLDLDPDADYQPVYLEDPHFNAEFSAVIAGESAANNSDSLSDPGHQSASKQSTDIVDAGLPANPAKLQASAGPALNTASMAGSSVARNSMAGTADSEVSAQEPAIALAEMKSARWATVFKQLPLTGVTRSIAGNSLLTEVTGNQLQLVLDENQATLFNDEHRKRIETALTKYFSVTIELKMQTGILKGETPVAQRHRLEQEYRQTAHQQFSSDPLVQEIIKQFSAEIQTDSVVPLKQFQW